jgi:phytanoyl-CoA hydroxylase
MLFENPIRHTHPGGSLTNEQKGFYESEGYLVLDRLLDDADLAPAREAMSQKVDRIANELFADGVIADKLEHRPFKYRLAELFTGLTMADFGKYGRSWRDYFPGYFVLMSNSKILDAVESLIGPEIYANPVFNVRPKVPKVAMGAVPWHQDKSYWPGANANPVITVWIPLVDSTEENGCLHLIPGTHQAKVLNFHAEQITGTGYYEVDDEHVAEARRRRPVVALPVKAGTGILFNDRLLHMSTPNHSDHVRWSVDLRYQPTDQDPMLQHGPGFLARSRQHPEQVATLETWLASAADRGR